MARTPIDDPQKAEQVRVPVGFLAGVNYCGSTLIAFILNAHPRIVSIGEAGPRRVPDRQSYTCSCGRDTRVCPFFSGVKAVMQSRGVPFDEVNMDLRPRWSEIRLVNRLAAGRIKPRALEQLRDGVRDRLPGFRRRIREYRLRNKAFIQAALQVSGKQVFLDGTKSAGRIPFLRTLDFDLRVVHVIRDPRGYCYSAKRHGVASIESAAHEWVKGHGSCEWETPTLPPDRWTRVRYEDVCREPEQQLSLLTEFLGAGPFELPDDLGSIEHHVIGNAMRLASDRRSAITLEEKWRTTLDPGEQATIARIAGPLAREFGYEI